MSLASAALAGGFLTASTTWAARVQSQPVTFTGDPASPPALKCGHFWSPVTRRLVALLIFSPVHDQHQLLFSHEAHIPHKQNREENDGKTGSRAGKTDGVTSGAAPTARIRGRKRRGASGVSSGNGRGGGRPRGDEGGADPAALCPRGAPRPGCRQRSDVQAPLCCPRRTPVRVAVPAHFHGS